VVPASGHDLTRPARFGAVRENSCMIATHEWDGSLLEWCARHIQAGPLTSWSFWASGEQLMATH
jgi:hypothetical protein